RPAAEQRQRGAEQRRARRHGVVRQHPEQEQPERDDGVRQQAAHRATPVTPPI
ncbi:hypothetical protein HMPREF0731_1345, partial [Pseudoroseomonas cervicalis ATCC 49957]